MNDSFPPFWVIMGATGTALAFLSQLWLFALIARDGIKRAATFVLMFPWAGLRLMCLDPQRFRGPFACLLAGGATTVCGIIASGKALQLLTD